MARKTKADLVAENERLRSKVREVYAAYYDMHKLWEKNEEREERYNCLESLEWRNEQLVARIDGLKEQIIRLKERKTRRKKANV